ncbi:hypothetical protein H8356DRAFT_987999 [Neocallimastix lanati (nom. inval.)]|nr:hypothetical protein H8356DRAFT_987999 [Neocallimastix sp. JGI-2020a]
MESDTYNNYANPSYGYLDNTNNVIEMNDDYEESYIYKNNQNKYNLANSGIYDSLNINRDNNNNNFNNTNYPPNFNNNTPRFQSQPKHLFNNSEITYGLYDKSIKINSIPKSNDININSNTNVNTSIENNSNNTTFQPSSPPRQLINQTYPHTPIQIHNQYHYQNQNNLASPTFSSPSRKRQLPSSFYRMSPQHQAFIQKQQLLSKQQLSPQRQHRSIYHSQSLSPSHLLQQYEFDNNSNPNPNLISSVTMTPKTLPPFHTNFSSPNKYPLVSSPNSRLLQQQEQQQQQILKEKFFNSNQIQSQIQNHIPYQNQYQNLSPNNSMNKRQPPQSHHFTSNINNIATNNNVNHLINQNNTNINNNSIILNYVQQNYTEPEPTEKINYVQIETSLHKDIQINNNSNNLNPFNTINEGKSTVDNNLSMKMSNSNLKNNKIILSENEVTEKTLNPLLSTNDYSQLNLISINYNNNSNNINEECNHSNSTSIYNNDNESSSDTSQEYLQYYQSCCKDEEEEEEHEQEHKENSQYISTQRQINNDYINDNTILSPPQEQHQILMEQNPNLLLRSLDFNLNNDQYQSHHQHQSNNIVKASSNNDNYNDNDDNNNDDVSSEIIENSEYNISKIVDYYQSSLDGSEISVSNIINDYNNNNSYNSYNYSQEKLDQFNSNLSLVSHHSNQNQIQNQNTNISQNQNVNINQNQSQSQNQVNSYLDKNRISIIKPYLNSYSSVSDTSFLLNSSRKNASSIENIDSSDNTETVNIYSTISREEEENENRNIEKSYSSQQFIPNKELSSIKTKDINLQEILKVLSSHGYGIYDPLNNEQFSNRIDITSAIDAATSIKLFNNNDNNNFNINTSSNNSSNSSINQKNNINNQKDEIRSQNKKSFYYNSDERMMKEELELISSFKEDPDQKIKVCLNKMNVSSSSLSSSVYDETVNICKNPGSQSSFHYIEDNIENNHNRDSNNDNKDSDKKFENRNEKLNLSSNESSTRLKSNSLLNFSNSLITNSNNNYNDADSITNNDENISNNENNINELYNEVCNSEFTIISSGPSLSFINDYNAEKVENIEYPYQLERKFSSFTFKSATSSSFFGDDEGNILDDLLSKKFSKSPCLKTLNGPRYNKEEVHKILKNSFSISSQEDHSHRLTSLNNKGFFDNLSPSVNEKLSSKIITYGTENDKNSSKNNASKNTKIIINKNENENIYENDIKKIAQDDLRTPILSKNTFNINNTPLSPKKKVFLKDTKDNVSNFSYNSFFDSYNEPNDSDTETVNKNLKALHLNDSVRNMMSNFINSNSIEGSEIENDLDELDIKDNDTVVNIITNYNRSNTNKPNANINFNRKLKKKIPSKLNPSYTNTTINKNSYIRNKTIDDGNISNKSCTPLKAKININNSVNNNSKNCFSIENGSSIEVNSKNSMNNCNVYLKNYDQLNSSATTSHVNDILKHPNSISDIMGSDTNYSSSEFINNSAIINMAQNIISKESYHIPKETSQQISGDFSHLSFTNNNKKSGYFNFNNTNNTNRIKNTIHNRHLAGSIYKKLNKSSKSLLKESQKEIVKISHIPRFNLHNHIKSKSIKTLPEIANHNEKQEKKQYNLSSLFDLNDNSITNKDLMRYQIRLYDFLKQRRNLSKKKSIVNNNELYSNLNNEISPNESLHLFHQFTGYRHILNNNGNYYNSYYSNNNNVNDNILYNEPSNIMVNNNEKNYIDENINNVKITSDNNNNTEEISEFDLPYYIKNGFYTSESNHRYQLNKWYLKSVCIGNNPYKNNIFNNQANRFRTPINNTELLNNKIFDDPELQRKFKLIQSNYKDKNY